MVTCTNCGTAATWYAGLPAGRLDFTGAVSLTFWLRVNKVGTGTQTWTLRNVTDNTILATVSDAGAVGWKELETSVVVNLAGVKKVRVEIHSTSASDDPVFGGWDVVLS